MMKKILAVIIVIVIVALGGLAYSFFKTPEEAGAPIEAISLEIEAASSEETENVEAELVELQIETEQASTNSTTNEAAASEAKLSHEEAGVTDGLMIFEIVSDESEVRFLIDEVLRNEPVTVVGTTDQVAGEFAVDAADLSTAQMGPIVVNARTLATDNDFRNRAIKNKILSTDTYEFITFTPTDIVGLSGSGTIGESYDFQIVGDLTIRDVTQAVTFDASATALSDSQLEGNAAVTILYDDFGLTIPASQSVSAVADEVTLEIDFVATAKDQNA